MSIRVIIADDEPPARDRLRAMLVTHADVVIVHEAENGQEAVDAIVRERPDIIFLDIGMPELSGVEVAEALEHDPESAPAIVFVTAHDEYALKAFDLGAVDYLLKPFDQQRFDRTLRTARERVKIRRLIRGSTPPSMIPSLLREMVPGEPYAVRLLVRRGRVMEFVRTGDVDWIDAQGNYARLHISGKTQLLRETMASLETRLDPARFIRVHRSTIVNIDCVRHIEPHVHGEFSIVMRDGARLTTSATHSSKLRSLLR